MQPFITFITPTYRRPKGLAACMDSVYTQTAVDAIEQIVLPDHIGVGIGGMYAGLPRYTEAVHGEYVHILCDDDVLAAPNVVAAVRDVARAHHDPPLILVAVQKGPLVIAQPTWPPICGGIDLGCLIVRADIWKAHVKDYGQVYEGDYVFAQALHDAGVPALHFNLLFLRGGQSHGAAEAVAMPTYTFGSVAS